MKIGILGTGMVGRAHAARLSCLGHSVMVGTRNVAKTLGRTKKDEMGNLPFRTWQKRYPKVALGTFAEAARHGNLIINALDGQVTLRVVKAIGPAAFAGKIVIDLANAVDYILDQPPKLSIPTDDSLAERIQRALPKAKVIKSLNNVGYELQVKPGRLAGGNHDVFVSGNDPGARRAAARFLRTAYGWKRVIDLGKLATARGQDSLVVTWLELYEALGTERFGIKIVK